MNRTYGCPVGARTRHAIGAIVLAHPRRFPGFSGDLLDALNPFGSRVDAAYRNILNVVLPALYGADVLKQLSPLSFNDCLVILKNVSYYYKRGYAFTDWRTIFPSVKKAFPGFDPVRVGALLAYIAGIPETKYPAYVHLLKTGEWNKDKVAEQVSTKKLDAISDFSYELTDKVKRGASAIATTGTEVIESASENLPFYLKPKIMVPALLVIGILIALGYSGIGKRVFSRREEYQKNPIDKAVKKYKEFHAFSPKKIRKIPKIDTSHLVKLGKALDISYQSHKWTGKKENYIHEFGKGVELMATPDGKHLLLSGGKLGVTERGIIN
jgi:hypothetical protein